MTSTPSFTEFDPDIIAYQRQVIRLIKCDFDYSLGVLELLLSGAVGSAKSMIMAHLAVFHCVQNEHASFCLGRRALPQLRDTIYKKIVEHLQKDFKEGKDFWASDPRCVITFRNGSEMKPFTWADKKYTKVRSYEFTSGLVEELTENNEEDKQAYLELKMRIGRQKHVREKFLISATNPGDPSHWGYKYFIESDIPTRKVIYSITTDNPFLPKSYVNQLLNDLDPAMAERMIYGKWNVINEEVLYRAYTKERNFRKTDYIPNLEHPIFISWDFNIGEGKPLSAVFFQYINDEFHFYEQVVVEGMRTSESCDEMADRGLLDLRALYILTGDAAGKHKDTRNIKSDYDIINAFFANYRKKDGRLMQYQMNVPLSNPAIRTRHNLVNSYCLNALGKVRLFVYKKAKTVDEGLRLTKLKKGGSYIEDDSKPYQHITTAVGYGMMIAKDLPTKKAQGTIRL